MLDSENFEYFVEDACSYGIPAVDNAFAFLTHIIEAQRSDRCRKHFEISATKMSRNERVQTKHCRLVDLSRRFKPVFCVCINKSTYQTPKYTLIEFGRGVSEKLEIIVETLGMEDNEMYCV